MTTRKVLITGGSSGLGLALAKALLQQGDSVTLLARDPKKLAEAEGLLRLCVPDAKLAIMASDVSAPTIVEDIQKVAAAMGGLDVLVNSAGILREGYVEALSDDDYRKTMDINFFGAVKVIRAALPYLKASGQGQIINIASVAALTGVFGYTAYCSAKYALLGFSEALRYELKPQGIKVQVVCPPEFDSPMVDALDQTRSPENERHTLSIPKMSVNAVVSAIVSGMKRNDFLIIPGAQTRLMALGIQYFPAISRWVADTRIRAVYRGALQAK